MTPELILQTHQQPTMWNKDMAIGGLAAALLTANLIAPGLGLFGALAGAAIGGLHGKRQMKHELENGKRVGRPSILNKDTLLGGLIGLTLVPFAAITGAMIMGALGGAVPAAAVGLAAAGFGIISASAAGGLLAGLAVAGAVAGMIFMGRKGKHRQLHEYLEALEQQARVEAEAAKAQTKNATAPQQPQKSFTAQIAQEREASVAQGRAV
jgi:hypothetical protein